MPSFKSVFLYATTALAGFAFASHSAGGHIGREVDGHALDRRCGCSNIPLLFADMQSRVAVAPDNFNAAVGVQDATLAFEVIQPHFEMLRGALGAAVEDIHAWMVSLDINTVLTSNGAVVSVSTLAELVFSVFVAICTILFVAPHACIQGDITECLQFIVGIGACLAELLKVTFTIVTGLQVSFCGLLQAHTDILGIAEVLGLVNIVDLLKAN